MSVSSLLSSHAVRMMVSVAAMTMVTACTLPRSGPSTTDFVHAGREQSIDLVEATTQDAAATHDTLSPLAFDDAWRAAIPAATDVIGVGDIVTVTIFERDGLGLFAAGTDGNAQLSGLKVDAAGAIGLPFVGAVRLAGMTPTQARGVILASLRRLTISTDVSVVVTESHSQLVSVQGDVTKPGVVPLGPETSRLSAVLATAGPPAADLALATVTVRRAGSAGTVRLASLYDQPEDDIALRGGDIVIVRATLGTVNVLGAVGLQGRLKIARPDYSVLDAVGDARGLDDAAANPAAVYVMKLRRSTGGSAVPRVYHFNFRNPAQIAVAAAFMVHDGDAVLISDASFTQARKILTAFSGVVSTARAASDLTN